MAEYTEKVKTAIDLLNKTKAKITHSGENWKEYLDTASNVYKYSATDQMMIYAQRPHATACAAVPLWNKHFNKYIKKGTKGIALLEYDKQSKPVLQYVFDVADTVNSVGTKEPEIWKLEKEQRQEFIHKLYQDANMTLVEVRFEEQLAHAVEMHLSRMEAFHNLPLPVKEFIEESVTYSTLKRCGADVDSMVDMEIMDKVANMGQFITVKSLSNFVADMSKSVLSYTERTIKKIIRENQRSIDKTEETVYDIVGVVKPKYKKELAEKEELQYGRKNEQGNRIELRETRGLSSARVGTRSGELQSGQIWIDESEISGSTQSTRRAEFENGDGMVATSRGSRQENEQSDRGSSGKNDGIRRGDGRTQSERSNQVDGVGQQFDTSSRGTYPTTDDLQLNLVELQELPSVEEQIEYILNNESLVVEKSTTFFDVENVILTTLFYQTNPINIYLGFAKHEALNERITVLKEFSYFNEEPSLQQSEQGVKILDENTIVTWEQMAATIGKLIDEDRYLTGNDLVSVKEKIKSEKLEEQTKDVVEIDETQQDATQKKKFKNDLAHRNYIQFEKQFSEILTGEFLCMQLEGEPWQPLNLERIDDDVIAISHTYTQNGDVMRDPEITFRFDIENQRIIPLTHQLDNLGLYQEVFEGDRYNPTMLKELNSFLNNWLKNLQYQDRELVRGAKVIDGVYTEIAFVDGKEIVKQEELAEDETELDIEIEAIENVAEQTPFERYEELKAEHEKAVVFVKNGDFYETFHSDAFLLRDKMDVVVIESYDKFGNVMPFVGMPSSTIDSVAEMLNNENYNVVVASHVGVQMFEVAQEIELSHNQRIETIGGTEFIITEPFKKKNVEEIEEILTSSEPMAESSKESVQEIMYSSFAPMFARSSPVFQDKAYNLYTNNDGKEFVFGYGNLGNGTTVWNYFEMDNRDYKTVAHISDDGDVKIYDKTMPSLAIAEIEKVSEQYKSAEVVEEMAIDENLEREIEDAVAEEVEKELTGEQTDLLIARTENYGLYEQVTGTGFYVRDHRDQLIIRSSTNLESPEQTLIHAELFDRLPEYIGASVEIKGRPFRIDEVNLKSKRASLLDLKTANLYPIFNDIPIGELFSALQERMMGDYEIPVEILVEQYKEDTVQVSEELQEVEEAEPELEAEAEPKVPLFNFKITDQNLGEWNLREKFTRNIEAIKTLKSLEERNEGATPEEQEIMSQYVGWGGLQVVFDEDNRAWGKEYAELKDLLNHQEYNAARSSTLVAYYTAPTVIESIYQALENMGIHKDCSILEPSMGVGNFFGMLPDYFENAKLHGVEIDSISGRLAKQLYPNARVDVKGFEDVRVGKGTFDVAIGNVPFGSYRVMDKEYLKDNHLIHDYFFIKSLDKVKAGGIVAFITSSGTMDKKSDEVRRKLAEKSNLLGAIRLPNTAFKKNADTNVVSDIIFLQKRETPIEITDEMLRTDSALAWVSSNPYEDELIMNQYFIDRPEMILGDMVVTSGRFGDKLDCKPNENLSLGEQLQGAITKLNQPNQELIAQLPHIQPVEEDILMELTDEQRATIKNYSYALVDGELMYRSNEILKKVETNKSAIERIKYMMDIRDTTREILDMQVKGSTHFATQSRLHRPPFSSAVRGCTNEELAIKQAVLNQQYDAYVKKFDIISSRGSSLAFRDDSSYPLLRSLENLDNEGNFACRRF